MRSTATSADQYFDQVGEARKASLLVLRERLRLTWPAVKEDLSLGMPTYHLEGRAVFALADQKNYLCLYVLPHDLLDAFRNELKAYNHGRTCIRFRRVDDQALDLCERIIRYVGAMHGTSKVRQVERL